MLTLTATPIPRTLQLSLAGLRDLTLLETAPKDRSPVLTFLEPHAMSRLASREHPNRRHSPRARLSIPVSLFEYGGRELAGQLTEVGVTGGKVRLSAGLEADTVAKLVFTLPDGGPPLEVVSILVRTDPDGYAFTFVRLPVREAELEVGLALAEDLAFHKVLDHCSAMMRIYDLVALDEHDTP